MRILKVDCSILLLFFVLYFSPGQFFPSAYGQSPVFVPAEDNLTLLESLFLKSEKLHKAELSGLPSRNKDDYQEVYNARWENIKTIFDNKEIYTLPSAQAYLDALVGEIVRNNPALQSQTFRCYFSRSGVPNASYIGQGIILFNMGLFRQLDNESEAAFILCHEIAHFYLRHSENSIDQYVAGMHSKEMQQALRQIKRSEYGKRQQVEKLMQGVTFNARRHTRDHEAQADSMALEFMRNTRFDRKAALSVLAILDNIDTDTLNTNTCLQKLFHSDKYPFKQKWIAHQTGLLGGHAVLEKDTVLEDSLKTHPDCQKRIALLAPMLSAAVSEMASANIVSKAKFDSLKHIFSYEIIEYAYRNDNYTRSLHYTIALLRQQPVDPYLITQVGKILNGCYEAQKQHILGKKIELPSPAQPPGYNTLLQFVQNLYLEDFAAISYYYLSAQQQYGGAYPPFNTELKKSNQWLNL